MVAFRASGGAARGVGADLRESVVLQGPVKVGLPDHYLLVGAARGKEVAGRGETAGCSGALVAVEGVEELPFAEVPDAERGVVRGRKEEVPARVEGEVRDGAAVGRVVL